MPSTTALTDMRRPALVALFAGGIAIGGSPIFMRLSEIGPIASAFWRLAIALVPLTLYALLFAPDRRSLWPASWRELGLLAVPGIFLALDLICWHLSVSLTSVTNATLLINLSTVFVTLMAWLLFGEAISRRFLIGLALALVGVVVLKGGGLAGGRWVGDLVAVTGAVFYAGYMIGLSRARVGNGTLKVMIWNSLAGALTILPVAILAEPQLMPATLHGWSVLGGLAMVSHVGGQAMIIFALAYLPTSFSSLTLLMQPVVAALLGVVILGEAIGFYEIAGGALVLTGILIARRQKA